MCQPRPIPFIASKQIECNERIPVTFGSRHPFIHIFYDSFWCRLVCSYSIRLSWYFLVSTFPNNWSGPVFSYIIRLSRYSLVSTLPNTCTRRSFDLQSLTIYPSVYFLILCTFSTTVYTGWKAADDFQIRIIVLNGLLHQFVSSSWVSCLQTTSWQCPFSHHTKLLVHKTWMTFYHIN
jgi:hypothetical protein